MSLSLLICLAVASALVMVLERLGLPLTLQLKFKGDVTRESRWVAQYGQGVCSVVAAALVWRLDPDRRIGHVHAALAMLIAAFGASVVCTIIKRLVGRVRPGRENAGAFLGPTWKHANARESFPSSHSASAIALSVVLCWLYPPAAGIFWTLAIVCAALRYVTDAHWLSDVLGGLAIGYGAAWVVLLYL